MKKLLAVMLICAMMTSAFASCGNSDDESPESKGASVSDSAKEEKEESEKEEETEPETEEETEKETEEETEPETEKDTEEETEEENDFSDATTEGSIEGLWVSEEDLYGFVFENDLTGGVLADASSMIHFTSDGELFMSSITVAADSVNYDGTTLSVNVEGTDMLTMKRNDASDPDSFDGEYTFVSGAFYDGMVSSMSESFGISDGEASVYAIIEGEKMIVKFANLFTYTAEDGELTISGNFESLGIPDDSTIEYKFSGDNLILVNGEYDIMVFTKVEY